MLPAFKSSTASKPSQDESNIPVFYNSFQIGLVNTSILSFFNKSSIFKISDSSLTITGDSDSLSKELYKLSSELSINKIWRNECFSIFDNNGFASLAIERSAAPLFGCRMYGCHLNVFTRDSGSLKYWIQKRSPTKQTWPGKFDNLVGGGLTHKSLPFETILKEAWEEAGISGYNDKIISVGVVTFYARAYFPCDFGQPDTEFVYDLEVDSDFKPKSIDGEAVDFELLDIYQVKEKMIQNMFTPEATIVCLDFLVRHGIITPENEPDYMEIVEGIHVKFDYPGPRF